MVLENLADLKKSQRNFYLDKIKSIAASDKALKSTLIVNHLRQKLELKSGCWTGFHAFASEPRIEWSQINSEIKWCFPVVQNDSMHFETSEGGKIDTQAIQGFVIPGLAFDRRGVRLGRGGGHYDRTLIGHKGEKIGVCFNVSFCQELPTEKHDMKVETIITDQQIYSVDLNS